MKRGSNKRSTNSKVFGLQEDISIEKKYGSYNRFDSEKEISLEQEICRLKRTMAPIKEQSVESDLVTRAMSIAIKPSYHKSYVN